MPDLTWQRSRCGLRLVSGGFVIGREHDSARPFRAHYQPHLEPGDFARNVRGYRVDLGKHVTIALAQRACETYARELAQRSPA